MTLARNTRQNQEIQFTKPIKGVPIPEHLRVKFELQPQKPDFVPVDPGDKVIAWVAMRNQQQSRLKRDPSDTR